MPSKARSIAFAAVIAATVPFDADAEDTRGTPSPPAPGPIELIVRGDDMGLSLDVNRGFIRAHAEGILTSASLMPPAPYFDNDVRLLKASPGLAAGVHITLVATTPIRPVLPAEAIPSLVDSGGFFHRSLEDFDKARPRIGDVETEARAQVAKFRASGLRISYLDWHIGPAEGWTPETGITGLLRAIAVELRVPCAQDVDGSLSGATMLPIWFESWSIHRFDDGTVAYSGAPELPAGRVEAYLETLRSLKPGTWWHNVHPALGSKQQAATVALLCSAETKGIIAERGIRLLSFEDLRRRMYGEDGGAGAGRPEAGRKKFIEVGWDIPSTAFLREHGAEMECSTPFDGVVFKVETKDDDGKLRTSLLSWNGNPWKRVWFEPALADLKACAFRRFTDNFLRFDATPGDLDWADDAGWAALSEKIATCAWLCRESGSKGPCLDFESYGAKQFKYSPEKGRTFAETAALARRRGAEFLRGIAREQPEATVLTFWLESINFKAGEAERPESILAAETYGLLPAFIDGMLDALPPTMTLVDGCEDGYYMDGEMEYLRAAGRMRAWRGPAARLVSPENRERWRVQVQAAFGFYLDMYLNEAGHQFYFPPLDGSRLARLERNLAAARAACDEYVWVYGEQCRWWSGPQTDAWMAEHLRGTVGKGRLWEEAMPGIRDAILRARDPVAAARAEVEARKAKGTAMNLARNPDFVASDDARALPSQWNVWQDEGSRGSFAHDAKVGGGSARAASVRSGVFLQAHDARPGERYAVAAVCQHEGRSLCQLTVRWQKADGKWTQWQEDRTFTFSPGPGGWEEAFGTVTVPGGAGKLVILLAVQHQLGEEDACWFDDVVLYRL